MNYHPTDIVKPVFVTNYEGGMWLRTKGTEMTIEELKRRGVASFLVRTNYRYRLMRFDFDNGWTHDILDPSIT